MPITVGHKQLRNYFSLLIILAGWVYLYRNDFTIFRMWDTEDYSYCYLVPLVTIYTVWQKRATLKLNQDGTLWPGYLGILLSGVFFLAGRLGSLETFIFFSVWLSIVSITAIVFGWKTMKQLVFPALILLFIIPPPAFIERTISFQLRLLSSEFSAQLLNILSVPVFLEGNIIDLGTIKLQVVDACSGLRYFLPTILLSLLIGYTLNTTVLSRIILLLLSAPITITLNTIRITITGLLVRYISPTLADGFFHDFQGWIIYLAAIALLSGCSLILKRFEAHPTEVSPPAQPEGEAAEAPPPPASGSQMLMKSVTVGVLCIALSASMALFIKGQTVPAWKSLESFPLQIGDWAGTRSYLDQETLDSLWADDYFLAAYQNKSTRSTLNLLVPYYKAQTSQHTAHAPTSCLLGSGWEIAGRSILKPSAATGRNFTIQQLILKKSGVQLLSNFWFHQRGRIIAGELENKAYLLYDAMTMRRTDGALVRIEMLIPQGKTVDQAQAELDAFTSQIALTLDTYLPNAHGHIPAKTLSEM